MQQQQRPDGQSMTQVMTTDDAYSDYGASRTTQHTQQHSQQHSEQLYTGLAGYTGEVYPSQGLIEGTILGEEIIETQVVVPVKRTIEETIMKPETIIREVTENQTQVMREKIIKYAVPEYEYVEQPVTQIVREEKLVDDVRDVYVENVLYKDQVVDVIQPHFVKTTVEVEVPHMVDNVVEREISVPRYKEKVQVMEEKVVHRVQAPPVIHEVEIPQYKVVEVVESVARNVPVAVDHIIHQKYELPMLETEFEDVEYPVFVTKFVEIAVPAEYMTEESILECQNLKQQVQFVASQAMPSACVLEDLTNRIRQFRPENLTDPALIRERLARSMQNCNRSAENPGLNPMGTEATPPRRRSASSQRPSSSNLPPSFPPKATTTDLR
eukprot:Blabericola_migrator_1__13431@NODE_963_length_5889_cov_140_567846_g668_i0_p2_GENE_NODE_963_length_5889_cov_140_567846_g668_i0NODE_963_length_5889_cov_140_567846_g668_i0_p2_ORF_typecomplete_len382_score78_19SWISNF_Ssr4/PF08549_10/1_7e02SWISNF_Ssr4/PF08549_10/0_24SWISNF_Ssr4/PF08549_10/5_6e03_NODE_963_length_5889_cov_140_567846_g668_i040285173